jgi:hypothetical protein
MQEAQKLINSSEFASQRAIPSISCSKNFSTSLLLIKSPPTLSNPCLSPQKSADVENFHLENNNVHNANDLLDSMAQRPSGSWDGKVSAGIAK